MSEALRRRGRFRAWLVAAGAAAALPGAGLPALAQVPVAQIAPTAAGAPAADAPAGLLRAGTEQNIQMEASRDPALPHRFGVAGDAPSGATRQWVVSVNVALKGAPDLGPRVSGELERRRLAGQVLFEEFRPPHAPRCAEVQIGHRVPVAIVQAVIAGLLPLEQRWSVQIVDEDEDSGAGATQRIYVGGMVQRPCALAPPSKLHELLTPGLGLPQMHRLLRNINATARQSAAADRPGTGA